jgi:hypothetical protein
MLDRIETKSKITALLQRLREIHEAAEDIPGKPHARAIEDLETRIAREPSLSLSDAALQLIMAASALELILEDLMPVTKQEIGRVRAHTLSALKRLESEASHDLDGRSLDYFVGPNHDGR